MTDIYLVGILTDDNQCIIYMADYNKQRCDDIRQQLQRNNTGQSQFVLSLPIGQLLVPIK